MSLCDMHLSLPPLVEGIALLALLRHVTDVPC